MGFEVVVRPVVFPNIRPAPVQSQPPADDPTQGIATINGTSGKFLDLQYSWSCSTSQSKPKETKRIVDEVRIYQMDKDDIINYDNFIDVQVANKIWMKDGRKEVPYKYGPFKEAPNLEVLNRNREITVTSYNLE